MFIVSKTFLIGSTGILVTVKTYSNDSSEANASIDCINTLCRKIGYDFGELPFDPCASNLSSYIFDCVPNCLSVCVREKDCEEEVLFFDKEESEKHGMKQFV